MCIRDRCSFHYYAGGGHPSEFILPFQFAAIYGCLLYTSTRGEHAPCRIPGVGGDGFRRDAGFPVHHGGTRDFHQLARSVVGVVRPDAVFIDFPQRCV